MKAQELAAVLLVSLAPGALRAGVGDFDTGFGSGGFAAGNTVGALPDGRLIYYGADIQADGFNCSSGSLGLQRTTSDGRHDPGFGGDGVQTPFEGFQFTYASVRTTDGKLLVGGCLNSQPALLRMDSAGNVDATFGNGGLVTQVDSVPYLSVRWVAALAVQSDGRVLVLINTGLWAYGDITPISAELRRFNSDGSLDLTLGTGGVAASPVLSGPITLLPGGVIRLDGLVSPVYMSSSGQALATPAASGSLPASTYDWQVAAVLPGGGTVLAGTTTAPTNAGGGTSAAGLDVALARLRADGSVDRAFGNDGGGLAVLDVGQLALGVQGLYQYRQHVAVSADGRRLYLAVKLSRTITNCTNCSNQAGLIIARLLIDASGKVVPDPAFGSNGILLLAKWAAFSIVDMVEQPGGALVLTTSQGRAFRLLGGPARSGGIVGIDTSYEAVSARESDGNLLVHVARTAGSDGAISVSYATRDHLPGSGVDRAYSATAGSDYIAVSGHLDWADGDTADKVITIPIIDDGVAENSESFDILLSGPGGVPILNPAANAVIINVGAALTATAQSSAGTTATGTAGGGGGVIDAWSLGCMVCCLLMSLALRKSAARGEGGSTGSQAEGHRCTARTNFNRLTAITTIAILGIALTARAGVGDIDPSYGNKSIFQAPTPLLSDGCLATIYPPRLQAGLLGDGSIVYATISGGGSTQYAHADANGQPDQAYASGGSKVPVPGFEMCSATGLKGPMLRTPDGRLWLGGSVIGSAGRQSAILRLDKTGSPDMSFGAGGLITRPAGPFDVNSRSGDGDWVSGLATQPDGHVLALMAGHASLYDELVSVRRYNTDGSDDVGFGVGGVAPLPLVPEPPWYFAILSGGWLYVAWDYLDNYPDVTLDANGRPGGSYGTNRTLPTAQTGVWRLLAVLPDGSSLYSGDSSLVTSAWLARLSADGSPMQSFGSSGAIPLNGSAGPGALLQLGNLVSAAASADGRSLFIAGLAGRIAKLDAASGALDPRFGVQGTVSLRGFQVADMVAQSDGALVVLGVSGAAVRLQGRAGPSPGLIGIASASASETSGTMFATVSRSAGSDGPVSVTYSTRDFAPGAYVVSAFTDVAIAGRDYSTTSGRLDWADGDTADKTIAIPVMSDAASSKSKVFEITLSPVAGSPAVNARITASISNAVPATPSQSATSSNVGAAVTPGAAGRDGGGGLDTAALLLLISLLAWRPRVAAEGA